MVKKPACQCRRHKRHRFDPWVGMIPWRRKWQPTPVSLPGKSHGQRSLVGYGPWGRRVGHDWAHTHTDWNPYSHTLGLKESHYSVIHWLLLSYISKSQCYHQKLYSALCQLTAWSGLPLLFGGSREADSTWLVRGFAIQSLESVKYISNFPFSWYPKGFFL